jgi:hypothetical protein
VHVVFKTLRAYNGVKEVVCKRQLTRSHGVVRTAVKVVSIMGFYVSGVDIQRRAPCKVRRELLVHKV